MIFLKAGNEKGVSKRQQFIKKQEKRAKNGKKGRKRN
jgi:hypothetical protein